MKSREIYKYLNEGENETKKCVICGKTYTGWGNDAWPVADGYCCDQCNMDKVIPARLAQMYGTKNESNLNEEDEWNSFTVNIGFGGYIGAEQEYNISARNKDEAVFHALDEAGSEAEQDLSVEEIEDVGDGEYEVEVGFAGLIGVSNNYTVRADNKEDAEMQALELAKEDLEVISVDGEEYVYESAKPKDKKDNYPTPVKSDYPFINEVQEKLKNVTDSLKKKGEYDLAYELGVATNNLNLFILFIEKENKE